MHRVQTARHAQEIMRQQRRAKHKMCIASPPPVDAIIATINASQTMKQLPFACHCDAKP
jgi:hypothetical protein